MKISFLSRLKSRTKSGASVFFRQVEWCRWLLAANIYVGKFIERVPQGSIVFFPCRQTTFFCGIAGIVAFKNKKPAVNGLNLDSLEKIIGRIEASGYQSCEPSKRLDHDYLGGKEKMEALWREVHAFNTDAPFFLIFSETKAQRVLRL